MVTILLKIFYSWKIIRSRTINFFILQFYYFKVYKNFSQLFALLTVNFVKSSKKSQEKAASILSNSWGRSMHIQLKVLGLNESLSNEWTFEPMNILFLFFESDHN